MEYASAITISLGVAAVIAFFILKRAVKWAIRLALLGAAALLFAGGGVAWWWNSRSEKEAKKPRPSNQEQRREPAAARPGTGTPAENRRPAARPDNRKAAPRPKNSGR